MSQSLIKILADEKVCPIIRSKDVNVVLDTSKALIDAGIKVLEINVEDSSIYGAIEEISKDAVVCAGGIITSLQAQCAINSGAKILSSPIFSMNLVKLAKAKRIPFIAGASTANEAYCNWKTRVPLIKIYPISAMGGVNYVENILRPMPFLNLMVQGSIKISEAKSYIDAGAKVVGIGRDLYEGYSYSEITKRAKLLLENVND